jgi:hypothetical protein
VREFDDVLLEPFDVDRLTVPLLRLTDDADLPAVDIKVSGQEYRYDRSYPIKGYSAIMPQYVLEQVGAGKKPLLVERPERFYLYWAIEEAVGAA